MSDLYAIKIGAMWRALKLEHLSLWLLCIYFFFEYVRPQSLYPVIDVLPYAQIFLFLTIISAFADPSVKWVSSFGSKLMFIFALVIVLSSIFAFRPGASLDNYVFFLNWFILYFLVLTIVNTETRLFLFLCAFFLFNLKMAQHGFFSWMQRGFAFTSWGLTGSPGWFRNSGEFAIEMLIFTPLATVFVIALRDRWSRNKKWLMYFLPVAGAVSIIGTSSRGGQLGLLAIALWMMVKSKKRIKALLIFCIVGYLLFLLIPAEQMQRFEEMGDDETSLQRMAYWGYGWKIMNDYPVLGVGYFNWLDYMFFIEPNGVGPKMIVELPHNIFFQAGAELGYTGLVIFIVMIMASFMMSISTRKMTKDANDFMFYLSYGLDAGMVGFLAAGFFVTVLYYPFFWVQYAMIMTLHSVAKKQYINRKSKAKKRRVNNKFIVRDS